MNPLEFCRGEQIIHLIQKLYNLNFPLLLSERGQVSNLLQGVLPDVAGTVKGPLLTVPCPWIGK
jgi:hypothetical protein